MEYVSRSYARLKRGHRRHFQQVVRHLDPQPEDRVLEIGCARGSVVRAVQSLAPHTYGIDVNPEAIASGVTHNLLVMSVEDLQFEDASFDKVYSFHAIEHVADIQKAFMEIRRVLRPGGRALVVYPAEPVRGLFSIPASVIMFKHPFKARDIHLHRLTPDRVRYLAAVADLPDEASGFSLLPGPEFYTVLRASGPVREPEAAAPLG